MALVLVVIGFASGSSALAASRTTTMTYCEQVNIDAGACPLLRLVTSVDGPRTNVNDDTSARLEQ